MKKMIPMLLLVVLASGCLCTGEEKKAEGCDNFTLTVYTTVPGCYDESPMTLHEDLILNSTQLADYCWSYDLQAGTCDLISGGMANISCDS